MSTLNVGTIKSLDANAPVFKNSTGVEKGQLAKAWVNFNGSGTIAERDSFNVSSLVDNGTGNYTVNFSTVFSDTNYCYTDGGDSAADGVRTIKTVTQNTNSFSFRTVGFSINFLSSVIFFDPTTVCLAFFGD